MLRRVVGDIILAVGLLTRFPLPAQTTEPDRRPADAFWAMPLIGLIIGALAGTVLWCGLALGLGAGFSAVAALATLAIASGCLHDDGLADFWDGVGGGRNRMQRLEIMRDSHIGTFGVVALIVFYATALSLIADLAGSTTDISAVSRIGPPEALIPALMLGLCAMLSRSMLVIPLTMLVHARDDGLAHYFGRPSAVNLVVGIVWPIALTAAVLDFAGAFALVIGAASGALLVTVIAGRYLGGYTGDVFGACIMTSFAGALMATRILAQ